MAHRNRMAMAAALVLGATGCATPDIEKAQSCLSAPDVLSQRHDNAAPDYAACANPANLAAMVANPADLQQGRTLGPANGERETLSVRNYEKGLIRPPAPSGTQAPVAGAAGAGQ